MSDTDAVISSMIEWLDSQPPVGDAARDPRTYREALDTGLIDEGDVITAWLAGQAVRPVSTPALPQGFTWRGNVYVVRDRDGVVLKPGDTVTDFRGDSAMLLSLTRGPEYNGTPRVVSRRRGGLASENYASVFDLTVTRA